MEATNDKSVNVDEMSLEHGRAKLGTSDSGFSGDSTSQQVVGSSKLYTDGQQLNYVPMPTPDPRDPLNLPRWRKWAALITLAFFGAVSLAAEVIVGGLVPIFALEYAGLDPKLLGKVDLHALAGQASSSANPLSLLASFGGPPLWKITLLSTLPVLMNGISSYFLVPLSIAIGRRPVLLACGVLAWAGGFWAGASTSLDSHLAARCIQGLGAGAVEALVPLTIQDLVFIHQRNRATSFVWAAQGVIIISLGVASPTIVLDLSWRSMYWISSGLSVGSWIAMIFFLPETRWKRTQRELAGDRVYPIPEGETRPALDPETYAPRTLKTNFGVFHNGFDFQGALQSMIDTARSFFIPTVFWIILLNSMFTAIQSAATQTLTTVLLSSGWTFRKMALAVVPGVVASPFVWLFGGYIADIIANFHARRNGGRREPEGHLFSLIIPLISLIIGTILYGYTGTHIANTPTIALLIGVFFISLGFLAGNSILSVFVVESYPQWAGPVLVNVASWRNIIGFALSFRTTTWVQSIGFIDFFGILAGVLGFLILFLPVFYIFGKRIRLWTAGTVAKQTEVEEKHHLHL